MKKVKFLRLASVMLMLCLITTCAISGTFAKYTTNGEVSDTARVAVWGVTVATVTDGDMFAKTYAKDDNTFTLAANSVVGTTDLIAPGTEGTLTSISITGTPEVAVRISYDATLTLSGFDAYCPIIIKVGTETYGITGIKDANGDVADNEVADVAALKTAVEEAIEDISVDYAAGTDLSTASEPAISWEWAFSGNDDAKDTALGNTGTATITLSVVTTVTQID